MLAVLAACSGDAGGVGPAGEPGFRGDNGEPGAEGAMGDRGAEGEPGATGPRGEPGEPGADGDAGVEGADGTNGTDGANGTDGDNGDIGPRGEPGSSRVVVGEPAFLSLSLFGHDRAFGATFDDDGNLYVVGQMSSDIASDADFSLFVAKLDPNGRLDPSFGTGGVAEHNVAVGGGANENARAIVLQSDGKIVIGGNAETDPGAAGGAELDTDFVLLRFTTDGVLDTTFGDNGVTTVDLNTGIQGLSGTTPTISGRDEHWSLARYPGDDRLVMHGVARALGFEADGVTPRADTDFVLLRFDADGDLDTSFSAPDGVLWLDLEGTTGTHSAGNARTAIMLSDGSIIGVGYTSSTVLGVTAQQPVLYKVDEDGELDATFAMGDQWLADGVWHDFAVEPPLRAEAYAAAVQQDGSLVTIGYGPTPLIADGTGPNDWVSFRFSAAGVLDDTYGTGGVTYLDPGMLGDNGRFVIALPDDRIFAVGACRTVATERDGMVAMLSPDGLPEATFAPNGFQTFDMGGDGDHFWAAALAPNQTHVAVVGIAGADGPGQGDDVAVLYLRTE